MGTWGRGASSTRTRDPESMGGNWERKGQAPVADPRALGLLWQDEELGLLHLPAWSSGVSGVMSSECPCEFHLCI